MLMTSSVSLSNESEESSSSLRNMPYMTQSQSHTQKWPVYRSDAQPSASVSSPSLSSYSAIDPSADQYGNDTIVVNSPLITPPSPSRLLPKLAGLPADALQLHPSPTSTLYSRQYQQQHYHNRNVVPYPLNASSIHDHPDRFTSHGSSLPANLESFSLSSPYSTQNVLLNTSSNRPRTSHPVFHSTSALAAHHGIPQSLPPVPRTSKYATASHPAPSSAPAPPVASSSANLDFASLCSNYLTMLSNKPEETRSAPERVTTMHDVPTDPDTVQAIVDVIQATPEFRMANDFSEYLTSPMEDSPFEDFLTTPALGSADMAADQLTSPAIFDADAFPDMGDTRLFGGDHLDVGGALETMKPTSALLSAQPVHHPLFDLDSMYRISSPMTPALDPQSLDTSPQIDSISTPSTPGGRTRKNLPTGTRKNITPNALVPLDAPIQPRKYVTPSATSRKEVPTAWLKKKRARSQAFGEEDELEDDLALGQGDLDAIEAKRRQNTLAARRSRKRKLEYQRELEAAVEHEKEEKEVWKQRAMLFKALLESHGHEVPSYDGA